MTQFWKCFYCRRALPALAYIFFISIPITFAANIGTVVPIIGQVADVTYDSQRNLVYLANAGAGQVEVYSPGARALLNPIQTGLQPVSLALSPDLRTLYVANAGSLSVSAIDLNSQQVVANYTTGTARPDAVAVGADGLVLILGPSGLSRLDPTSGLITVLPVAVPATPPAGLPNIPA